MSLVTVGKNGRVYARKFDHDRARVLRVEHGWSYQRLADYYGVSYTAVERIFNPKTRARLDAHNRRSIQSKRRPCLGGCGKLVWLHIKGKSGYCPRCNGIRIARTVRPDTLRCSTCHEWKPDDEFHVRKRAVARRGRHSDCRTCATINRREHRRANAERERIYQRDYKRRRRAAA